MSTVRGTRYFLNNPANRPSTVKPGEKAGAHSSLAKTEALRTRELEFRDNFAPTEDLEEEEEAGQAKEGVSADKAQDKQKPQAPAEDKPAGEAVEQNKPQTPGNPIADFLGGIVKGIGDIFKGIGELIFGKVKDDNENDGIRHVMVPGGGGQEVPPDQAEGVKAEDGRNPIIVVGGAGGTLAEGEGFAQYIANQTGDPTRLIHNATNRKVYEGGLLGPVLTEISKLTDGIADFNQVSDDWYGRGNNPSVNAVKDRVREQLNSGNGEARLAGFSQGNQIIARALRELAEEPGMAEKMKNVSVMNMSGPVRQEDYPPGIKYDHLEMASDPVANRLGEAIPNRSGVDARNADYNGTLWGLVFQQPWWGHAPDRLLGTEDGSVPQIDAQELAGMGVAGIEQMMAIQEANRQRLRTLLGL